MNQSFEAWAKKFYQECQMTINSPNHWTNPNEYMLSTYQNAWEGWQGCSQHHEAKIAEMQAELDNVKKLLLGSNTSAKYGLTKELYQSIPDGDTFIQGLVTWGEDNDVDDTTIEYIEAMVENKALISLGYDLALETVYSTLAGVKDGDYTADKVDKLAKFYEAMGD